MRSLLQVSVRIASMQYNHTERVLMQYTLTSALQALSSRATVPAAFGLLILVPFIN
jgi:hypothetical protein